MDGLELRIQRRNLEVTQDELAKLLGYGSGARISEMEKGHARVPVPVKLVFEALAAGWRPDTWPYLRP